MHMHTASLTLFSQYKAGGIVSLPNRNRKLEVSKALMLHTKVSSAFRLQVLKKQKTWQNIWYLSVKTLVFTSTFSQLQSSDETTASSWNDSQYLSVAARWASDLEESEAIQHCNVYFTHHFIPMDLKPSPTNTTGVMINIFDIHNIQQTGWTDRGWGGERESSTSGL